MTYRRQEVVNIEIIYLVSVYLSRHRVGQRLKIDFVMVILTFQPNRSRAPASYYSTHQLARPPEHFDPPPYKWKSFILTISTQIRLNSIAVQMEEFHLDHFDPSDRHTNGRVSS